VQTSYSALREAADRIGYTDRPTVVLYMGDFDPSGQDMPRDIRDRLTQDFGVQLDLHVIALTREQIATYDLPPAPAKRSDSRAAAFMAKHGDMAVELDALPPDVLQDLVRVNVARFFDKSAFQQQAQIERAERAKLEQVLEGELQ